MFNKLFDFAITKSILYTLATKKNWKIKLYGCKVGSSYTKEESGSTYQKLEINAHQK